MASQIGAKLHAKLRTSSHFARLALLFEGMLGYGFLIPRGVYCVIAGKTSSACETETVVAVQFAGRTDAEGFPAEQVWERAPAIQFAHDWQGKNEDLRRKTEARVLWTRDALYVRFLACYRSLTIFADAETDGRRDKLWERDVAEVFLQPVGSEQRHYKEFEVSPNGFWIDLDIAPGQKRNLKSGLRRRVKIDEKGSVWKAELALPMKSLTACFDPSEVWRVNFYRVEGPSEPRFYSAWRPTGTPAPNFHVPGSFGSLVFET
jgi:alpha-galactosidase